MTESSVNSSGLSRAASISPRQESAPRPLSERAGPHPVLLFSRVDLLIVILSSLRMYPTADPVEPGPDSKSTLMINRFWSEGISTPTGCQPASTVSKMSNEIQDKHSHTSVPSGVQVWITGIWIQAWFIYSKHCDIFQILNCCRLVIYFRLICQILAVRRNNALTDWTRGRK